MTLTLKFAHLLLVVCLVSCLHALPHKRHLLQLADPLPSSFNHEPSSSNKPAKQNTVLFFDPSHKEMSHVDDDADNDDGDDTGDEEIHRPQAPLAEDEVDDGLDAMKVLNVDLEDITVAPNLKEAFPDLGDLVSPTPILDTEEATLSALVDNQIEHVLPGTSGERDGGGMGAVQQSLASALSSDIENLLKTYKTSIFESVKTLYEDYSLKGDSIATTIAPPTPGGAEEWSSTPNPKPRQESSDSKQTPPALQSFFAKYDFEVDADVIQDKLFAAYNSLVVNPHDENQHDEPVASHFHPTKEAPFSTPKVEASLCETTHDPREIFRNIDFGDIRKTTEQPEEREDNSDEAAEEEDMEMPETDYIISAISTDLGEDKTNSSSYSEPFVQYFTDAEKEKYDSETIEEFYDRFFSMKGAIIQPIISS